jgi:hypothetical protein
MDSRASREQHKDDSIWRSHQLGHTSAEIAKCQQLGFDRICAMIAGRMAGKVISHPSQVVHPRLPTPSETLSSIVHWRTELNRSPGSLSGYEG